MYYVLRVNVVPDKEALIPPKALPVAAGSVY